MASVKLPANKVPTGMAITNTSEYALVTVWDTTALKGQVAVISLAGLCNNCDPYNQNGGNATGIRDTKYDRWYDWWHEWMGVYPGLPNMGNIAFMKVLGYIDLPGMKAPTEIAVTTGFDQFQTALPEKNGDFMGQTNSPLTDAGQARELHRFRQQRQPLRQGGRGGRDLQVGAEGGLHRPEAAVQLRQQRLLRQRVRRSSTNLGQADNQWPYTFANKPQQTPTVIKTVALDDRPTAVKTTLFGNVHRAWIATQDGTLRIYGLGNVPDRHHRHGRRREGPCRGRARTRPRWRSRRASRTTRSIEPLNQQVLVASRGDRKVQWVRFASNGNSGSVVRTLQDSRIIDPIAVEDADNFASDNMVLSIADYTGKAVSNYRYGPVIFANRGGSWACQPPGGCPVQATGGMHDGVRRQLHDGGPALHAQDGERALIASNVDQPLCGPPCAGRFFCVQRRQALGRADIGPVARVELGADLAVVHGRAQQGRQRAPSRRRGCRPEWRSTAARTAPRGTGRWSRRCSLAAALAQRQPRGRDPEVATRVVRRVRHQPQVRQPAAGREAIDGLLREREVRREHVARHHPEDVAQRAAARARCRPPSRARRRSRGPRANRRCREVAWRARSDSESARPASRC